MLARGTRAARRVEELALCALIEITSAIPALAQKTTWAIDPQNSSARLFIASSNKKNLRVNVGVARVSGEVEEKLGDSGLCSYAFQIFPADKGATLAQGLNSISVNDEASTVISFKSRAVTRALTSENEVAFNASGELTVMHVHRFATYDPNKVYSGPIYGPPMTRSETKEAIFVFRSERPARGPERKRGAVEWAASAMIPASAFPELLNAILETNWPPFTLQQECANPTTAGKNSSGQACKGKIVEPVPRTDVQCSMPATTGEDFAGEVCTGTPLVATPQDMRSGRATARGNSRGLAPIEVDIELEMRLAGKSPMPTGNHRE